MPSSEHGYGNGDHGRPDLRRSPLLSSSSDPYVQSEAGKALGDFHSYRVEAETGRFAATATTIPRRGLMLVNL
jgi:hypothetical protein